MILPGLLVTSLILLLLALLRWGWDPVPLRVAAGFYLVILLLFGSSLFGGRVLLPLDILTRMPPFQNLTPPEAPGNPLQMDLITQVIPLEAQVRRALAQGRWPLWNDLAGAGMPLLADPQSQALQPLVWLTLPLHLDQAAGALAALRVFLTLLFTFLFLRRQGLGEGASLAGALAFGLSGFVLLWLGWPMVSSAVLLPLVLYALAWVHDRGGRRDVLLLTLAAAALLAGGHPETLLYSSAIAAAFAFARLLSGPPERRRPTLLRWVYAGLLALGLTAPAWLPALAYLPQSHRHELVERRNLRLLRQGALAGWSEPEERRLHLESLQKRLVPVVVPGAYGNPRAGEYWGDLNFNERGTGFAGTPMLLLALLACVPTRSRRLPQERLFLAVGLLCLVVLARPPGLERLIVSLPVINNSASLHERIVLGLVFSLSYVGSCALERRLGGEDRRNLALMACGAGLALLILWGVRLAAPPQAAGAGVVAQRSMAVGLQLAVLLATTALLLVRTRGRSWLLAALIAGELFFVYGWANPGLPRRLYYPPSAPLDFLRRQGSGFRVAGLGGVLLPNVASVYGLADARVANPSKPFLVTQSIAPVSRSVRATEDVFERPVHPIYQLFAVRYLLVPPGTDLPPPLRPVFQDPSLWIFERPEALPLLFLPRSAEPPGAAPWYRWLARDPDFAARALADRPALWQARYPQEAALDLVSTAAAHWRASLSAPEERLVASSLYQDGGWRLLVDRRPHPAQTANGPFVATWVSAGRHRLDLLYRPAGFVAGCVLAALALACAALGLVSPPPRSPAPIR